MSKPTTPPAPPEDGPDPGPSRRGFLKAGSGSLIGLGLAPALLGRAADAAPSTRPAAGPGAKGAPTVPTHLKINGKSYDLDLDSRTTLLDTLRENLGLTGTKKGCNHGSCGACTVHVDGRRVNSCLTLAATCDGQEVTSIEGIAGADGELHPVQAAFIQCDGYQCGYCTPGQIMSATALLKEGHAGSDEEIREWMSGNLCRCGAYPNIVDAVKMANQQTGEETSK